MSQNNESDVQVIEEEVAGSLINKYTTKEPLPIKKGRNKGTMAMHFKCNYCDKAFVGPSNSSVSMHLRKEHKSKCLDLIASFDKNPKPKKAFFDKRKMRKPFDVDIFMGKLMKWIVRSDQPFSTVDDPDFIDMMKYIKNDIDLTSRRTLMRRLDTLYSQTKGVLKAELGKIDSKFSLTCDVWTSKNQHSFFGFTLHYINADWEMCDKLLAFKFLEGEHDGVNNPPPIK